jgi:hypothetical protein
MSRDCFTEAGAALHSKNSSPLGHVSKRMYLTAERANCIGIRKKAAGDETLPWRNTLTKSLTPSCHCRAINAISRNLTFK